MYWLAVLWINGLAALVIGGMLVSLEVPRRYLEASSSTLPSSCTFSARVNAAEIKLESTFRPTLGAIEEGCGRSFSAGAVVESAFYVNGAISSRQTSYMCDAACGSEPTKVGPRSCTGNLDVSNGVCPLIYVPKHTPIRAPLMPLSNEDREKQFRNLTDYCNSFIWTDEWAGEAASSEDTWKRIYNDMVDAFTTLPLPFTILESGNFCGASTCFMAATKRALCPDCPFLSVDPGYSRQDAVRQDGTPMDPQCVEKNMEYSKLADYVTVLDKTSGQEAPIRGPVGYIFNDDGKMHEIVSVQHPLWEPYIMNGGRLGYHDYWDDGESMKASQSTDDHRSLVSKWEEPKMHRTWIADLVDTPDYVTTFLPKFISEFEERPPNTNWLYDVGQIQKIVRDTTPEQTADYFVEVTIREAPVV